jgi:hypothetical protein
MILAYFFILFLLPFLNRGIIIAYINLLGKNLLKGPVTYII